MNLRSIILYNHAGDRRVVAFRPGELNIVTGWSATGKSALLDITEFCLGRDTVTMPVGPITDTVAWYAVLVQLPTTRAFVARPAPRAGRASTQQAMLELGADLEPLDFADLSVNANSDTVREQLGRLIGIQENLNVPEAGALRAPLEAHLGHAVLLCLQRQGEIGNRDLLFHRQGEPGIRQALIDTLPYFLGAVPADQALKRQQLQVARRHLRRIQADGETAARLNADVEVELRALVTEAHAKGMLPSPDIGGRDEAINALSSLLQTPLTDEPASTSVDTELRSLEQQRNALRQRLRELAEQRALFDDQERGENGYQDAARKGANRLRSLRLMPGRSKESEAACPMCGSELAEPDPHIRDLQATLDTITHQLRAVETAQPRRVAAMTELERAADETRQDLRTVESAIAGLRATDRAIEQSRNLAESRAFTRGRIDLYLTRLRRSGNEGELADLRLRYQLAKRTVDQLAAELDPDEEREQLTSRLLAIADDMTQWADQLLLEHRGRNVRLDLSRLTIVTDTDTGPAPLFRIGSAENWIGYHLIAHLALHRYFVRQGRPVPHLLMLDQPTQAYYPSEVEQRQGTPSDNDDRAAVRRLFELMRDVATELAPELQIIVSDHADLPERWFQEAVRHNWRRGDALIPQEWIDGKAK
ncbi:DUF3732 domain-containing protein [Actinoplanes awajinensis]|uniref:DUF3732 domain-containing protein n=1 Tax=Actinoplanes awajinensis subsp. mycoplanecinus TaxID=135947 RepID=A0A117MKW4_9ACTN|nr:DUF3732 domain-containing protein [Actinoplanes awajinensis]KUL22839.1 hypothetical protein ADL15_47495 [Actinoplanes awajinensis subsp. mycoplanecinus]